MSNESKPIEADPYNPAGEPIEIQPPVGVPVPPLTGWEAEVEKWFTEHVYSSPYHTAGETDPFVAGYREAAANIRALLVKHPPTASAN